MRPSFSSRLNWWQRSRIAVAGFAGTALAIGLGISWFLASLGGEQLPTYRPIVYSVIPLMIVLMIMFFARTAERNNMRSGGSRALDDSHSVRDAS